MREALLLANPDSKTLRPTRSRASTIAKQPVLPYSYFFASFLGGDCVACAVVFVGDGLANFLDFTIYQVGDVVCQAYKFGGTQWTLRVER
ncbi:hypothetical protein LJR029_002859 [Caballeronia sp. LjRoot29]|uniref:hypothetical protein n=1 Tax=Caballeronia sp. LjRoot29 TaxID=3342315 RepID=UPI003ED0AEC0